MSKHMCSEVFLARLEAPVRPLTLNPSHCYRNSRILLHKRCAIFDEVRCRCSENLGYGSGCDGIDSDCNNVPDNCDEDVVAPEFDTTATLEKCSGYFDTLIEAENCILETIIATDDCSDVSLSIKTSSGDCLSASVTIMATQEKCNKITEVNFYHIKKYTATYRFIYFVYEVGIVCVAVPMGILLVIFHAPYSSVGAGSSASSSSGSVVQLFVGGRFSIPFPSPA